MAIREIIRFKKTFDKIDPRLPKKLVGDIGEFYVLDKLEDLGFDRLEHKGGQAGFDIYIVDIAKKVEVRTSLFKHEKIYPLGNSKYIHFFGWKVKGKKEIKYDILICVELDDNLTSPKFYIFNREDVNALEDINKENDIKIGRFSSVQKKIHIFKDKQTYQKAIQIRPELITKFESYINEHLEEFQDRWDKIEGTK